MDFRFLKKEIKRNIVGYVIIVLMTLVGVGFLSGLFSCVPDIKHSVNDYYNETNFHDIKVTASHGFLEDDIKAVQALDGLEIVQPVHSVYSLSAINGAGSYVTYVRGFDRSILEANASSLIDTPVLIEGSYPATQKSCLVVKSNAFETNIKIGDRVALLTNTDDCTENTFTVTGFVNTPEFTSNIKEDAPIGNGKTEIVVYVSDEIFAKDMFYNELLCTLKKKGDVSTFDKDYTQMVRAAVSDLTKLGQIRSDNFAETLSNQYQNDLDKAQKQYEYVKGQTEEELKTLSGNISDLEKSIKELEELLPKEEAEVLRLKLIVDNQTGTAKRYEISAGVPNLNAPDGEQTTSEQAENTSSSDGSNETSSVAGPQEKPLTEYEIALKEYETANAKYNQDKSNLETKKNTLKSLKAEYSVLKGLAGKKIDSAQKNIAALDGEQDEYTQNWSALTREENLSYNSFLMNAQKINTITGFFPIIFFIVAVSIVLAMMGRLIKGQRRELGILQSLGYSDKAITVKYAMYALSATLIGGILGIIAGVIVIPQMIFKAYSVFYNFPKIKLLFQPFATFGALLIEVALVLSVTVFSCYKQLKGSPAELLRPIKENSNKKIFLQKNKKRWAKYSQKKKTCLINIFGYKSRLAVMLIGVIGCTALILSSFGLDYSIGSVTEKQYALRPFDVTVMLTDNDYSDSVGITNFVNDKGLVSEFIEVKQQKASIIYNDKANEVTAVLMNDEKINDYYKLENSLGFSKTVQDNSVIISRNFAESTGIGKGDEIKIAANNKTADLKVTAVCTSYIGNYLFLGKSACGDLTNDFNKALLIKNGNSGYNKSEITSDLLSTNKVSSVAFTSDEFGIFSNAADKIQTLLTTLVVSAVLLCFAVISITTVLNYKERSKEIKERLSNGESVKTVVKSVFAENAVITVFGVLLGIILGVLLHTIVVSLSDMTGVMLASSIGVLPFVFALVAPLALMIAVNIAFYPILFIKQKKTA